MQVGGSVVFMVMVILRAVQRSRVNIVCLCIEKLIVRNWLMWFWIVQGGPGGPADGADGIGKQPAEGGRGAVFFSYLDLQVIGWSPHILGRPVSLLSSRQFKCVNLPKLTHWKRPGCREGLKGKAEEGSNRGWRLDDITDSMYINLGKVWEMVRDREAWGAAIHGVTTSWSRLANWTTT